MISEGTLTGANKYAQQHKVSDTTFIATASRLKMPSRTAPNLYASQ